MPGKGAPASTPDSILPAMKPPVRRCGPTVLAILAGTLSTLAFAPLDLISIAPRISASASGDSWVPLVSDDGRWIAFQGTASNLTTNDFNGPVSDVFLHEVHSGVTRLASPTQSGLGGDGDSEIAGLSRDGRFIVFVSSASNLVEGDDNGADDVFLFDRESGGVTLVSVTSDGASGNGASIQPVLSEDGRYVTFESEADDLVPGDTNEVGDVFQRDLQTGGTRRISGPSADPGIARRATGASGNVLASADGQTVVFQSDAQNLAAPLMLEGLSRPVTNNLYYLRPPSETNRMVNVFTAPPNQSGIRVSFDTRALGLSADGRYLLCQTVTSLVSQVPSGFFHVDLDTGAFLRVNAGITGNVESSASDTIGPILSADGRKVFLQVGEADPETGLANQPVVYQWEAEAGVVTRLTEPGPIEGVSEKAAVISRFGTLLGVSGDGAATVLATRIKVGTTVVSDDQIVLRHLSTGRTHWVSRGASGQPVDITSSPAASVSGDGNSLAFNTLAGSLVEDDANQSWDVFRYEAGSNRVSLISARAPEMPSRTAFGSVYLSDQALSGDGRFVGFASSAYGYSASGAGGGVIQAVRGDRLTGSVVAISVDREGQGFGNGSSTAPGLSADGQFAVFTSTATNLLAGDDNGAVDVFLRDLELGRTLLVSARPDGAFPDGGSEGAVISPDARWVAFASRANDLTALDRRDNASDVYLWERTTGVLNLVSINAAGSRSAAGRSGQPMFSPDGQWLVFESQARDLVPEAVPAGRQIYRRNLVTGVLSAILPGTTVGTTPYPGPTPVAAFSPDGRYLAFLANQDLRLGFELWLQDLATGTVERLAQGARSAAVSRDAERIAYGAAGETPTAPAQVRVLDRASKTDIEVSQTAAGVPGDGRSEACFITPDGRWVVFASDAANLVPGDDNGLGDVFVRDMANGELHRVDGDSLSSPEALSANGRVLALRSTAGDLVAGDFNRMSDVFTLVLEEGGGRPVVHSITRTAAGELQLAWFWERGQDYAVEQTDRVDGSWTAAPATLEPGDASVFARIPLVKGEPQRFFRVVAR